MKIDPSFQPFQVYQGGLESEIPITKPAKKGPSDHDWLRDLPVHARFLSKRKFFKGPMLECYGIIAFTERAAFLFDFTPVMGAPNQIPVDTAIFSRDNELIEVLETPPEEEGNNEQRDIPVEEPREEHD